MSGRNSEAGIDRGRLLLYALSTCVWCGRTKKLLRDLGVAFEYIDVDLLSGDDRLAALTEMERWNPDQSFPTLVVDGRAAVTGFDERRIREALGL